MRIRENRGILSVCAVILTGMIAVCLSGTLFGREDRFEVRHEITTPAYRTDMDRMMDAYQQLMNNYMRLTESHLMGLNTDVKAVQQKLDAIDAKMAALSSQLSRIEKHLGIELPKEQTPKPKEPEKQAP